MFDHFSATDRNFVDLLFYEFSFFSCQQLLNQVLSFLDEQICLKTHKLLELSVFLDQLILLVDMHRLKPAWLLYFIELRALRRVKQTSVTGEGPPL